MLAFRKQEVEGKGARKGVLRKYKKPGVVCVASVKEG